MTIAAEMQQAYLFQGIPPAEVKKAAPGAQEAFYEPGEYIYRKGDAGQAFYIITKGKVELIAYEKKNTAGVYGHVSAGGHFGEVSLLTGKPRTATITAEEETELLELSKGRLNEIIKTYPRVQQVMERYYNERVQSTLEMVRGAQQKG